MFTPFTKSEFLLTSYDLPHSVSLIMLLFAMIPGCLVVGAVLVCKGDPVLKIPPGQVYKEYNGSNSLVRFHPVIKGHKSRTKKLIPFVCAFKKF